MKKILLAILFLFLTGVSYAQDIAISADVDKQEIALDEQLNLIVTVNGNVSNIPKPKIPSLDGFNAYSSGRSQNISIINGQVKSSVAFAYVLVPNDTGEYTLGPFSIDYKGKTYSTDPISVTVTPKARKQTSPPSYVHPQSLGRSEYRDSVASKQQDELFIETYVDKLRPYVNEQVTLTFLFYQSVNLFENPVYRPPSTTGFWTEDMPPQNKYYKTINGTKYLVTEIKTALFATSPGEFTIGPARLEASVEDLERFFSKKPFDFFDRKSFSMFRRGKPIILTTDPIRLEILPLPDEGKPLNFKGDVGRFDISADIDKTTVEKNQPITLKIKIKGAGNIKTISSPTIPETGDMKFYDSGSSENISKKDYMVQGEKIFEKVVIPKKEGSFKIGPIEYSYFDPATKKYIERAVEPIVINVTKSKEEPIDEKGALLLPGLTKEDVRLFKRDIAYIKTSLPGLKHSNAFLYRNKIFLVINILPIFLLAFLYIYERHRERVRTDLGYARSRRAKGLVSKRLKTAKKIMLKKNIKGFYAEIYKAAIEYIADKLNIPHASITKDVLERRLAEKGFSGETIEKLKSLFDVCDMARFASGRFTGQDMHKTLKEAIDIVSELERAR
ncbi:BatD family protein [Candidatus Omnitrophota bacterium]